MNILILKKFNNYANRIVVRYETIKEYTDRAASNITFTDINFNPNDGVMTELIIGNETQRLPTSTTGVTTPIDWDTTGAPDYLICIDNNQIVSRWFITECIRTRLGQFHLQLKRDSIADHLEAVTDATCFIEKGIIEDSEDPAIYNKEPIKTNQIKSDEFLLKDETQSGWIVGYVAKDRTETDNNGHMSLVSTSFSEQTIPGPQASDSACSEIYTDETAFYNAHPECIGDLASLNSWTASVKVDIFYGKLFTYYKTGQTISVFNNGNIKYEETPYQNNLYLHAIDQGGHTMLWKAWVGDWRDNLARHFVTGWFGQSFKDGIISQLEAKENIKFVSESTLQSFFNFIKRKPVIKIGTKYYIPYDIYGELGSQSTVTNKLNITIGSTAYDLFYNGLDLTPEGIGGHDVIEGTPGEDTFTLEWSYNRHALGLREIYSQCKAKIPASVPILKDAPYHMFAIPFSDNMALYSGDTLHCVTNKSVAMNAAQALAQKAGVGVVYDVQLLPYCPVRDIIKTTKVTGHYDVAPATYDYVLTKAPNTGVISRSPIAKVNHTYVIAKDIALSTYRALGIQSTSPIKIKIDDNTYYDAYKIIVRYTDLADTSSTPIIQIYKTATSETPEEVIDYNTYASADYYIKVETTDICKYLVAFHSIRYGWTIYTIEIVEGGVTQLAAELWKNLLKDYIFYEDYYLTKLDISNAITSDIVTVVEGAEVDIVNTIFWCTDSQFSFNKYLDNYFLMQADGSYKQDEITELINEKVKMPSDIAEIKTRGQTDMLRLASPNYSSFFDVNVVQNRGIEYINIDCTYKPYQPYIHLNPNFKGLYGADYNDVRGLICGGDYSIATTTDAWATYQLQNKNYQAVFDRQIQQLETQHEIQHSMDVWNAVTGVGGAGIGGAVSGALAGAKIGGGYGAAAGAIVGGVTGIVGSTLGAAVDISNAERIRELQRTTMKDIHYMQLDNIKALPLGLAKTSYLTNNNKLFPFLEFYTCTSMEDMAVRNYMDYNGMTINRIGKISDFQSEKELPYIKAQLIRIDIQDDPHQVTAISSELSAGVYLPEIVSED